MNLLIKGPALTQEEHDLLLRFEKETFIPSFPNDDEREDMEEDIIARICDHDSYVRTFVVLSMEKDRIAAGLVCDWYPVCNDLEVIYISVNPNYKRRRLGSTLLQEGIAEIVREIEREGGSVRRVYFETENPSVPQPEGTHVMQLSDRLSFFGRNGGSILLDHYFQPPLSEGKDWASNMLLCTLPVFCHVEGEVEFPELETSVPEDEVMEFLTAFYHGLDEADETEEGKARLEMMRTALIPAREDGNVVLKRIEYSSFRFPYATVSSHFFIEPTPGSGLDPREQDPVFNSYECDLMQYGFQEYALRPIVTHHKEVIHASIQLPREYRYESEGSQFHVRQCDERILKADISFNWSYHRKFDKYLATVVFTPSEGAFFTELDVLKLIALLGFGSKQENFEALEPVRIAVGADEGEDAGRLPDVLTEMTFPDLVKRVFCLEKDPEPSCTGITEIDLLDTEGDDVYADFAGLKADLLSDAPEESVKNKTLCGFFLGIFDYLRMNQGEIADTVDPFMVRESYFMQLFRGNLIQIRFNSSDERIDDILTSAYLIIPSVVLAMNERVLKENYAVLNKLNAGSKRSWKMSDYDRYTYLSDVVKRVETSVADNYVKDIFHYVSERMIMQSGNEQRGLTKSLAKLQESVSMQKSRSDEYRQKYTSSIDTLQNLILLLLAILQVATIRSMDEISPFAWFMMGAAILIGGYLFFRKRT